MFAEVKNNVIVQFPYDYDTLCRSNPTTAFPSDTDLLTLYAGTEANLNGASLERVIELEPPPFNPATEKLSIQAPIFNGSNWVRGWSIDSLTGEEQSQAANQKATQVRSARDQKLKDTDWRVIKALENNQAQDFDWAAYRQALRDIPSQSGFPWQVQWPIEP